MDTIVALFTVGWYPLILVALVFFMYPRAKDRSQSDGYDAGSGGGGDDGGCHGDGGSGDCGGGDGGGDCGGGD